jgi:hypothetical protein
MANRRGRDWTGSTAPTGSGNRRWARSEISNSWSGSTTCPLTCGWTPKPRCWRTIGTHVDERSVHTPASCLYTRGVHCSTYLWIPIRNISSYSCWTTTLPTSGQPFASPWFCWRWRTIHTHSCLYTRGVHCSTYLWIPTYYIRWSDECSYFRIPSTSCYVVIQLATRQLVRQVICSRMSGLSAITGDYIILETNLANYWDVSDSNGANDSRFSIELGRGSSSTRNILVDERLTPVGKTSAPTSGSPARFGLLSNLLPGN